MAGSTSNRPICTPEWCSTPCAGAARSCAPCAPWCNLAQLTGRSKTFYMIEAIREHLDDLEDLYVAEQRLIEIRAGRSSTSTLDDVEKQLGLAD